MSEQPLVPELREILRQHHVVDMSLGGGRVLCSCQENSHIVGDTKSWMPLGAYPDHVVNSLTAADLEALSSAPLRLRISELEAELTPFREEEKRQKEWNAFCAVSDVRCLDCNLRYGERDQYGCGIEARNHYYDEDELREAGRVED